MLSLPFTPPLHILLAVVYQLQLSILCSPWPPLFCQTALLQLCALPLVIMILETMKFSRVTAGNLVSHHGSFSHCFVRGVPWTNRYNRGGDVQRFAFSALQYACFTYCSVRCAFSYPARSVHFGFYHLYITLADCLPSFLLRAGELWILFDVCFVLLNLLDRSFHSQLQFCAQASKIARVILCRASITLQFDRREQL